MKFHSRSKVSRAVFVENNFTEKIFYFRKVLKSKMWTQRLFWNILWAVFHGTDDYITDDYTRFALNKSYIFFSFLELTSVLVNMNQCGEQYYGDRIRNILDTWLIKIKIKQLILYAFCITY